MADAKQIASKRRGRKWVLTVAATWAWSAVTAAVVVSMISRGDIDAAVIAALSVGWIGLIGQYSVTNVVQKKVEAK